jgi:hypothetical protein
MGVGRWFACCLFTTSVAWGAPPESPSPAPPANVRETRMVGYGWSIVAMDAAALALEGAAIAIAVSDKPDDKTPATMLALTGLSVYLFGPMYLHLVRGNPRNALWSVGLRFGAPLVIGGSFALASAAGCHDPAPDPNYPDESWCQCGCTNVMMGLLGAALGIVAAMAIDAGVVAREPARRERAWNLAPSFDPRTRAAGLSLTGAWF